MLQDTHIDAKFKIAALWVSAMFCFIFADYFCLFMPGHLVALHEGKFPPPVSGQNQLSLFMAALMVVPSLMIFASVALPARLNRPANIVVSLLYALFSSVTTFRIAYFMPLGLIQVMVTLAISYQAWAWPRTASST